MSITVPFSGIPNTPLPPPQKPQQKTTNPTSNPKITVYHPDEGATRKRREIILEYYVDKMDVEKLVTLGAKGRQLGIDNEWDALETAIDLFNRMDPSAIIRVIGTSKE